MDAILRDLTFYCSSNAPHVWPRVAALLESGALELDALVTRQLPFDQLPVAVALARDHPERLIKAAILGA